MAAASVTETFAVGNAVELAVVERSGFVESRHAGSAVVLRADGTLLRALGDVTTPILPRSSMKPFQAIAVMASGVTLRGEDAAVATASHSGTEKHATLARGLLARAGVPESALGCPAAWPDDTPSRDALVRLGAGKAPIYMNCSGKHAAMLAACAQNDWPLEGYLDPAHPLQKRILDVVERFTGERPAASGIDGCGAPVHALSLTALARGIARIATSKSSSPFAIYREAGFLAEAVRSNGWVIAGPGMPDTVVIDRLGLFIKTGAEGIMVASADDGTTVALKVLDGSLRAATIVALSLLADAGAIARSDVDALAPELHLAVSGGGRQVGQIRASYI
ncbi:asparaginase [Cryobacterium tagatosivorans]|uniref:Asparaginase n=1 Tax=Cryobacterium tagatosivorans TaxID=1259199 RepID=A0A4R8UCX7_9MICO|nr:asparaginase [Cryobacterium tagatosivorans]TFB47622.1 asparaginase [Cryobacterium tagatosivorans]